MELYKGHAERVKLSLRLKRRRDPKNPLKWIIIGYYLVAYDSRRTPKRRERALGTKSSRVAHALLEEYERLYRAGKIDLWRKDTMLPGSMAPLTCQEAVDAYLTYKETTITTKGTPIRSRTLKMYTSVLTNFLKWVEVRCMAGILLCDLVKEDIMSFVFERIKKDGSTLKEATIQTQFNLVRECLDWCVTQHYLDENPVAGVKVKAPEGRITYFTPEQEEALLHAMELHASTYRGPHSEEGIRSLIMATQIGIEAGLRQGEIIRLEWRHVELTDQPCIHVVSTTQRPTKNGKSRTVPIARSGKLFAALVELKATAAPGDDRVLVGPNGGELRPNYISSYFTEFVKRANLPPDLVFHSTRHTYGTRLAAVISIAILKELMGHSNIQTTMRYVHVSGQQGRSCIDDVFGRAA